MIVIPVIIALGFLLHAVVMLLSPGLEMRGSELIGLFAAVLTNMLFIRLCTALSGAAMGDDRLLSRSWDATGGITFTLFLLGLLYTALALVDLREVLPPTAALAFHVIVRWLQPLFWISISATLWKSQVAPAS